MTGLRIYRQRWGPLPRQGYMWIEEYETLESLERDSQPPACTCDREWAPILAAAVAGTFRSAIWADSLPENWFSRGDGAGEGSSQS
jgi:hypothetical protein